MKNIDDIKSVVLNTEDIKDLYEVQIDITEHLSQKHDSRSWHEKGSTEYVRISGEIALLYSLLEICKDRINKWNDIEGKCNYNFRMAARMVLTKDTYEKVSALAKLPRDAVKGMKSDYDEFKLQ